MSKNKEKKLFIVRKYIMAKSATEAIKMDKLTPVDDVWVDDEWKKGQEARLESSMGFTYRTKK
jgi:hypothetical protein